MPKTKVEVYDKDQLIYPFIESDHVTFSNGMKITEMLDQSISMPKVTHEDSSFKVGVGDQDVSSAIVDSSVAEMTIKGQTYQNILPEPTLRNEMQGKSMQRLNEGYDNIEVVDGVSKSAILSGNTLVNLIKKLTPENYGNNKEWGVQGGSSPTHICNSDGSITATSTIKGSMVLDYYNLTLFKPNTEYTLFVSVDWNGVGITPRLSKISTNDISLNNGLNIVKFTTVSDLTVQYMAFRLGYAGELPIGCEYTFNNIMVIEGDHTQEDIPYFTGMQSVKMPVLTTTGKNLFQGTFEQGSISGSNGQPVFATTRVRTMDFIKLTKGNTYTFSVDSSQASSNIMFREFLTYSTNDYNSFKVGNLGTYKKQFTYTPTEDEYIKFVLTNSTTPEGVVDINAVKIQIEHGTQKTSYEPYKSNILTTPEDLELRGIGDVKDKLNVATGELTQRIGEIVLDGSGNWKTDINSAGVKRYFLEGVGSDLSDNVSNSSSLLCDKFKASSNIWTETNDGAQIVKSNGIYFIDSSVDSLDAFVNKLKATNIKVQYSLIEKPVKTVDLSSSGNWEKIVLDGSENWSMASESSNGNAFFRGDNTVPNNVKVNSNNRAQKVICDILTPFTQEQICNKPNDIYGISLGWNDSNLCVRHKDFPLTNEGLTQWKQYLQQNPVTVWYQTTTTQDNSIREMLSFANGHLQVSSEAENSLLPSVQYEIPTKNSYHMDLMKTNTLYTMKAKTVSGTFTIDGTSYNVNANGTFTSPSSMTDKLLVMSNKTNEEVMLLEGNVIDKTIPYFKGIKSAFEDEDKVEVLSNSGNLANYLESSFAGGSNLESTNANNELTLIDNTNIPYSFIRTPIYKDFVFKKGRKYHVEFEYVITNVRYGQVKIVTPNVAQITNSINFPISNNWSKFKTTLTPILDFSVNSLKHTEQGVETCLEFMALGGEELSGDKTLKIRNVILSEDDIDYKPYKQNVSKIPLLSPLRSLPNGVCDELIIDRMKKKATLIQRVGKLIHHGQGGSVIIETKGGYHKYGFYGLITPKQNSYNFNSVLMCDTFMWNDDAPENKGEKISSYRHTTGTELRYVTSPNRTPLLTESYFRDWLSRNPVTVYYELETPVITEVDLEGFPYIYKDGHIFLNSDIAPTTQITYSINQAQQIESANEDLQRHEKEISRLQKLIAQYIQVEYESTLLSLKI